MRPNKLAAIAIVVGIWLASAIVAHGQTINGVLPRTTAATLTAAGSTACTNSSTGCVVLQPSGYSSLSISITGTWVGTIAFESCTSNCSVAGSWASLLLTPPGSTTAVTSATANGQWLGAVPAFLIRARFSAFTSGSAVVSMYATLGNIQPAAISGGGGGSTPPAGSDTQVQFNNGGAFGASDALTFDSAFATLSVSSITNNPRFTIVNPGVPNNTVFMRLTETGIFDFSTGNDFQTDIEFGPYDSSPYVLTQSCNSAKSSCSEWTISPVNVTLANKAGYTSFGYDGGTYQHVGDDSNGLSNLEVGGGTGANSYVYAQGCDGTGTNQSNCATMNLQDIASNAGVHIVIPTTNQNPNFLVNDGLSTQLAFIGLNTSTGQFAVNNATSGSFGSFELNQSGNVAVFCNTLCAHKFAYHWDSDLLQVTGTIDGNAGFLVNGTTGKTGTVCTVFTKGLCTAATEPDPSDTIAGLRDRVATLERLMAGRTTSQDARSSELFSDTPPGVPIAVGAIVMALSIYGFGRRVTP